MFGVLVLLRFSLSNIWSGKSFLVGEVAIGFLLAALAAIIDAKSDGFPLRRLEGSVGRVPTDGGLFC